MDNHEQDLAQTLKQMKDLLVRAHAVADPILARWRAEEVAVPKKMG